MSFWCKRLRPANTDAVLVALRELHRLVKVTQQKGVSMNGHEDRRHLSTATEGGDLVQISQAWLDSVASTIETAVGLLRPYIANLLTGQAVTLNSADIANVQQALADLGSIEPPAPPVPAPANDNPPADNPVIDDENGAGA